MSIVSRSRRRTTPLSHWILLYGGMVWIVGWFLRTPSTPATSAPSTIQPSWTANDSVVHVVQTRFMQEQSHLTHLGRARLELFEAITLPSVQKQTSSKFLWIIRTDPHLEASLRDDLLSMVQDLPHAVVISSNDNPEGFRHVHWADEVVWTPNRDLLLSYAEAAQTRRLLETRLDADDALRLDWIEYLQQQTFEDWKVWCVGSNMEWQYYNPWTVASTIGALWAMQTGYCVTAGLTWGYDVHTHRSDIDVPSRHDMLHRRLSPCSPTNQTHCLDHVVSLGPGALRARTPTSAGLLNLWRPRQVDPMTQPWSDRQDKLWELVPVLFGVDVDRVQLMRARIESDLAAIVQDAVSGQCTKGHSCKSGSKRILEELLQRGR